MGQSPIGRGRPPGARNKRTVEFLDVLEAEGFDPARALIELYREARKVYDNYGTIYDAICDAREEKARETGLINVPPEDKADKYLKIAMDAAKELASYAYPRLKAIEKATISPLDGMTAAQKLEAFKQAIPLLEAQAKAESSGPINT